MACQSMAYHSAASLETAPTVFAVVICVCLMCQFASFSRVKRLREVGPLSRPVMWSMQLTQPVSAPLQNSLRFLPDCCPHRHRPILRCAFPLNGGAVWIYPVPLE